MTRMSVLALACAAVPVALLAAGFVYQAVGARRDRRLREPGRLIEIGQGHRLYVLVQGEGEPTVVFESGFAATSLNWSHLQNALSPSVRTFAYDRAGLGWSTPAATPRTPLQIARELRSLLAAAGVAPPFLLVGHSFGGLVMRRFALDYPDETVGAVLIDPMRTSEWPPVDESQRPTLVRARRLSRHAERLARFGVTRLAARSLICRSGPMADLLALVGGRKGEYLASRLNCELEKLPPDVLPSIAAQWSHPNFYRGLVAHLEAVPSTVVEMHDAAPIRGCPVVVVTPHSAVPLSAQDLNRIGTDCRQVFAENSSHWVHLDEPQLMIETILGLVRQRQFAHVGAPASADTRRRV